MNRNVVMVALFASIYASGGMAQLKDPRTRDENISATTINTSVTKLSSGFYEYTYDFAFPEENLGRVQFFKIDLSCELDFGNVAFPEPPISGGKNYSEDGNHVPVQLYHSQQTFFPNLSVDNEAIWLFLEGTPGTSASGLRIISPAPPGLRNYKLQPEMEPFGWDYSEFEEDPTIPWIDDFTVEGLIKAPACAFDDPEPEKFAGSVHYSQNSDTNELLMYAAPLRSQWHAEPDENSVEFEIFYSDDIYPESVKVQPGWVRKYLNPSKGGSDTVEIRLRPGMNKIIFEARTEKSKGNADRDKGAMFDKDVDVFEIRSTSKGQSKK
ncbi:hypothetical protein [Thiohalomonas denitrificans]|uniref:hypothetical protein n=1 Tax=Thiohalomonas denitrificans TaxID=415747 RepID=UPI0026EFC100|nr:hypothetical protein [Thiohalomonas denitrificans]